MTLADAFIIGSMQRNTAPLPNKWTKFNVTAYEPVSITEFNVGDTLHIRIKPDSNLVEEVTLAAVIDLPDYKSIVVLANTLSGSKVLQEVKESQLYRKIEPVTRLIGNVEVPCPVTKPLATNTIYYVPDLSAYTDTYESYAWEDSLQNHKHLANGLVYRTAADAAKVTKALQALIQRS